MLYKDNNFQKLVEDLIIISFESRPGHPNIVRNQLEQINISLISSQVVLTRPATDRSEKTVKKGEGR